jgi:hypothetical protein
MRNGKLLARRQAYTCVIEDLDGAVSFAGTAPNNGHQAASQCQPSASSRARQSQSHRGERVTQTHVCACRTVDIAVPLARGRLDARDAFAGCWR